MKTFLALIVSALAVAPLRAELFGPGAANGTAVGAIAGAIIGNNSHGHNAWRGAAIGAGAGYVLGSLSDAADRDGRGGARVSVRAGYGYGYGHGGGFRHHHGGYPWHDRSYVSFGYYDSPYAYSTYPYSYYETPVVYSTAPAYAPPAYYVASRPSYAASGTILGGIAGAIIGHNSGDLHHNGWKGAAIGAGAGLILGSIIDNAERSSRPVESIPVYDNTARVTETQSAPAAQTQQAPVTIINNYYNTSPSAMTSANSLYGR